jgi:ferritin-like metal-binding protein YciE
MDFSSAQTLNSIAVRSVFIEQLSILYNAKVNLTDCLPGLVEQATFRNLKLALSEDLEETEKQMISLKTIFNLLNESWLTNDCLGTNAVILEAHKHIAFNQGKHFESDMSILFYMSVIENLQVGASQMLKLMSLKRAFQPYAQLISECLDMVKDNSVLFYCVAEEYLQSEI